MSDIFIKISFDSARLPFYRQRFKNSDEKVWIEYKKNRYGEWGYWSTDINQGIDVSHNQMLGKDGFKRRSNMVETIVSNMDCGNPFGTAENLIHLPQVSNMLHVFLGERPVSSFHNLIVNGKQVFNRCEFIDEIVRNGYYKIDNVYTYYDTDNDRTDYITETTKFQKCCPSNATSPDVMYWNRFRKNMLSNRMTRKYFDTVISILTEFSQKGDIFNNYATLDELIKELHSTGKFDECQAKLLANTNNCKGVLEFDKTYARPSGCKLGVKNETSAPKKMLNISGSFIFKVSDEVYNRIIKGRRAATYLDGGLALLEKWQDTGSYSNVFIDDCVIEDKGYKRIS